MPHHTHSHTARGTAKSSKTACIKPFSGLTRACCLIFIRQCLIFGHSQKHGFGECKLNCVKLQ